MAMDEKQMRQMLPVGTLLQGGKYRVERYMASGGFGNTYEVEHVELHTHYALKEFFMRGINQREGNTVTVSQEENRDTFDHMRSKFYSEAQRLAVLNEPHIVKVTDLFKENDTAYYVMELVNGLSLSSHLKQGQPFTEQQVRHGILPQILSALKYVHKQGILHLDLKPGNIMQNSDGHCCLIDFGASKQMSSAESQTLSTSTGLCYTPGFAPIEQINGNNKRIGPWTDFYALGATLYNLLTAQTPPSSDDIQCDGASAFTFPPAVSTGMRSLIVWLMKPTPTERPQSINDISNRLAEPSPVAPEPATPDYVELSPKSSVENPQSFATVLHDDNRSESKKEKPAIVQEKEGLAVEPKPADESKAIAAARRIVNNMMDVNGGSFMMGDKKKKFFSFFSVNPNQAHQVTLSSFSIGKFPVVQSEWEAVMGYNNSSYKGSDHPVTNVNWEEAHEFIDKLNSLTGLHFRLPTEAEWEFAARGGNLGKDINNKFAGSSNIETVAWYYGNSGRETHPVGQKAPNELGLYDMTGNVWEWCQDWYDRSYYEKSPSDNPRNDTVASLRVIRGGSWGNFAQDCRVTFPGGIDPLLSFNTVGLRLAL